jgi:hypothetical protein
MSHYFVIHNSDGDTHVEMITKDELLERLDPENPYYGTIEFLERITKTDTNYWNDKLLIIKGDITVPKQVLVVKKYGVD